MINPMELTGRTILVTGASSGIGREVSILLSKLGARLVLVGRSTDRLKETCDKLETTGHLIESFDLTAVDDISKWLKGVMAGIGPLSGLVHCAGLHSAYPIKILDNEKIEKVMRINVNAAIGLAKAFRLKGISDANSSIVFLSSVMGVVGESGVAAYAASKGAIVALTKSLAMEFARERIRVNCIVAGSVGVGMAEKQQQLFTQEQMNLINEKHPLGTGTALDVAYAVAFLLADTGRWITGTALVVDGGYTAH